MQRKLLREEMGRVKFCGGAVVSANKDDCVRNKKNRKERMEGMKLESTADEPNFALLYPPNFFAHFFLAHFTRLELLVGKC
jgi:hypothetical protein